MACGDSAWQSGQPIVCCNSSRRDFSWIAVGSLISWSGYLLIEMEFTGLRAGEGRRSKVEGRRSKAERGRRAKEIRRPKTEKSAQNSQAAEVHCPGSQVRGCLNNLLSTPRRRASRLNEINRPQRRTVVFLTGGNGENRAFACATTIIPFQQRQL
jgi:hypothetical protein